MHSCQEDKTKVCPKCGTEFTCSPLDCWCSKLPAVMPMDVNASCYCPQCLKSIIDKKLKEQGESAPAA